MTRASVRGIPGRDLLEITARITELDPEWDVERVQETNAAALALTELVPGTIHDRRWTLLPWIVLPFLLQHAPPGVVPPRSRSSRRPGIGTRREIDREGVALKTLRGDFGLVSGGSTQQERAKLALAAAGE